MALTEAASSHTGGPPTPDGDVALVHAARLGGCDRAAMGHLYERYARMVHGIALARVPRGGVSDANDLVQDVFLDALHQLHTVRDAAAVGPWLATIARRRAAEYHRSRRHPQPLMIDRPDPATSPHMGDSALNDAAAVLAAIRSLPPAYCETLVLRLVEGLTGPQIAACTGLTPGSVRVNLHRGMQLLREKLGLEESSS